MSGVYPVLAIAGAIIAIIVGLPAVWRFLCLPGRIEERLQKLDKLDAIEAAATEARDEWQGATEAVNRLAGDHEGRISSLEAWRKRIDRTAR